MTLRSLNRLDSPRYSNANGRNGMSSGRLSLRSAIGLVALAAVVLAGLRWSLDTADQTGYGANTGILRAGQVVEILDVATDAPHLDPQTKGLGVVVGDGARDGDDCMPDRPIYVQLESGAVVSIPRSSLRRAVRASPGIGAPGERPSAGSALHGRRKPGRGGGNRGAP